MSIEKLIEKALYEETPVNSKKVGIDNEIVQAFLSSFGGYMNTKHPKDEGKTLLFSPASYDYDAILEIKVEVEKKLDKSGEVKFTIHNIAIKSKWDKSGIYKLLTGHELRDKTFMFRQCKDVGAAKKEGTDIANRLKLLNNFAKKVQQDAVALHKQVS